MAKKMKLRKVKGISGTWYVLRYLNGQRLVTFETRQFEKDYPKAKLHLGQSCRVTTEIRKVK